MAAAKMPKLLHVSQIRKEIETTDSDYDLEKLQERLAKLAGRRCCARRRSYRNRAQREEASDGRCVIRHPGGRGRYCPAAVPLIQASKVLDKLQLENDAAIGVQIVRRALAEPVKVIANNAGAKAPLLPMPY